MSELEIEQQNAMPENGKMVLRTENLVKKYGKRTVVSHVSFDVKQDRKSTRLNSSHSGESRMPSSA